MRAVGLLVVMFAFSGCLGCELCPRDDYACISEGSRRGAQFICDPPPCCSGTVETDTTSICVRLKACGVNPPPQCPPCDGGPGVAHCDQPDDDWACRCGPPYDLAVPHDLEDPPDLSVSLDLATTSDDGGMHD